MKTITFVLSISAAYLTFTRIALGADVLTYHNDIARTGLNPDEILLNPGNVNPNTFGLLFNLPVDGKVDAQPLYASSVSIVVNGRLAGRHNLIIVATEHDSVYAFDADTGVNYWKASLLLDQEVPSDPRSCGQVYPEIGITATPVIDRNNGLYGTIYLVAMSMTTNPSVYHQRLHALDLATGKEIKGGPVEIQASYPGNGQNNDGHGNVTFDPGFYKERAALLLLDGTVYLSWSSHCDHPTYTGWIMGYDENTLQQKTVINLNPNGNASGNSLWSSGGGPAADALNNIYVMTANGPFETNLVNGFPALGDYGDSFVKLQTSSGLAVSDYFTPFDQANDAANDLDLGSGGAVVLPDQIDAANNIKHLVVGAGKDTNIYLLDRDNLGKYNEATQDNSNIYQELPYKLVGAEFGTPAYFNGAIYYGAVDQYLKRFALVKAKLDPVPSSMTNNKYGYPGVTPSISSAGSSQGIVWAYENSTEAVLHAYDALDLSNELYNSNQAPEQRDNFGAPNKFITPTICNGHVYAATTNSVGVFGLLKPVSATDVSQWINVVRGEL
ncbi:MAG: pyrrolo-quinoline quinone, partial [Verrucomicrobia bacterium]|nr:pyrrolo-quinoline quinone [Verrucomicrobiota bacterium]